MKKKKAATPKLLEKQTHKKWKTSVKVGYYAWNFGWLLLACVVVGAATLLLSAANYDTAVFKGYFEKPMIAVVNILLPLACSMFLYLLIGRMWIAHTITTVLSLGIAVANYLLIAVRNDPLQFADILCLAEALDITATQHYELHIGWEVIASVAVCAGMCVALALLARWTPKVKKRMGLLVAAAAVVIGTCEIASDDEIYRVSTRNYEHINTWSSTQIYISRGVLYSFTRNAMSNINSKPEGYEEAQVKQLLEQYPQTDIPADKKVNIFVIMRESYCDLSTLDVEANSIDFSCYDNYHSLVAEGYTGKLITNGFGGNTKNAERCFMTGSYAPIEYRKPANSYIWYLREQGYAVEGAHPFNGWFYNRSNINCYLGFETYHYREDVFDDIVGEETIADDEVLYDEIWRMFEQSDEQKPYFNFSVTYEGHGPYNYRSNSYGTSFVKAYQGTADGYAMENYLGCVYKRDKALMKLVEKMRASDRPIILLTFGDHKPTLGSDINNYTTAAYETFGIDMNMSSQQGFVDYYGTEYLIWANDAAKQMLGITFSGQSGPMISPCYLMNVLFDTLDWNCGSSYLQAMNNCMEQFPVVSSKGRVSVDGELVQQVPTAQSEAYKMLKYLDYYWKNERK